MNGAKSTQIYKRLQFETMLINAHEDLLKSVDEGSYLSDIKIVCSDGTLYYNKLLLTICQPYLKFIELVDCQIIWPDVSIQELSALLSFKFSSHSQENKVYKESETTNSDSNDDFNDVLMLSDSASSVLLPDSSPDVGAFAECSLGLACLLDFNLNCTDGPLHSSSSFTPSASPQLTSTVSSGQTVEEFANLIDASDTEFIQEQRVILSKPDNSEELGPNMIKEDYNGSMTTEKSQVMKEHMCEECGFCYSSQEKLKKHVKWKHSKKSFDFECKVCHQLFQHDFLLKRHFIKHKQPSIKCGQCLKYFKQQKHLNVHMKSVHEVKSPIFTCPSCSKEFKTNSNLTRHLKVHKSEKFNAFQCLLCDKSYKLQFSLERHLQSHVGNNFKCDRCNKQFARKDTLSRHTVKCKK